MSLLLLFSFCFGAIVGSFLNVCIYRIPARLSIVSPASRCPKCEAEIRWYQNVPIISWVLLGGRCAKCRVSISSRYPMVEALTGVVFLYAFYVFGFSVSTLLTWVFLSALIVVTFIDIDHQIIPNVISLPGILFCLLVSPFLPWLEWYESLFGAFLGAGLLFLVAISYKVIAGRDGMGMGDLKLLAMIGAFLGWKAILPVVFLSSLFGVAVGLPLMFIRKSDGGLAIPYGPYLSLAAVVYLFWWFELFSWYKSLFY